MSISNHSKQITSHSSHEQVSDKFPLNMYSKNVLNTEQDMSDNYCRLEIEKEGIQVILEYPQPTDKDSMVKQEIQKNLESMLKEQIKQIS